jgi:2-methylisocitrate lyase-like PEP mutase family enzyme
MIFVEARETTHQIRAIARSLDAPLLIDMFARGETPRVSARELRDLPCAMGVVPSDNQRAAIRAMQPAAATLLANGSIAAIQNQAADLSQRGRIGASPHSAMFTQRRRIGALHDPGWSEDRLEDRAAAPDQFASVVIPEGG